MLQLKQVLAVFQGHITHTPILSFGVHDEWIGDRVEE
jgi:hypothetical protein